MKKSRFEEVAKKASTRAWAPKGYELNGVLYDENSVWAHLVPNCGRAELRRRLWYWEGKKKRRIPRGIAIDACQRGVLYPRDGGVIPAFGWNAEAFSFSPQPIICGRIKYGKTWPREAVLAPPLNLDGSVFRGGTRTEHLKAILNGLAKMCNDTFEGKEVFMCQNVVKAFGYALYDDYGRHEVSREECDLRAALVVSKFVEWYEGWTKAGQPIEPEVEE